MAEGLLEESKMFLEEHSEILRTQTMQADLGCKIE